MINVTVYLLHLIGPAFLCSSEFLLQERVAVNKINTLDFHHPIIWTGWWRCEHEWVFTCREYPLGGFSTDSTPGLSPISRGLRANTLQFLGQLALKIRRLRGLNLPTKRPQQPSASLSCNTAATSWCSFRLSPSAVHLVPVWSPPNWGSPSPPQSFNPFSGHFLHQVILKLSSLSTGNLWSSRQWVNLTSIERIKGKYATGHCHTQ